MYNDSLLSPPVEQHLTQLLKDLKVYDSSLDVRPGSIKGDNYLGVIAKVRVAGKNKTGQKTFLNLIVKSAPGHELLRKSFPVRDAYEREIYVYTKVLPTFAKFQEEKQIVNTFKSFAKFYSSSMEDLGEALVMEDMKEQGFKLWNRFEPLDYNHASLVMQNYAKLHALSFAIHDQNPDLFKEMAENTKEKLLVENANNQDGMIQLMQDRVDTALTGLDRKEHKEAYEKLTQFREDMMGKIHASVKPDAAGRYAVIGHGDCWINNLLFKYGDPKEPSMPTQLCLIDWQLSRISSPVIDLSYFVYTCTDKRLRDEHYLNLINEYYNNLCSFLKELGSDPEKLFPYEVLQQHLKQFSVYGLFTAVVVLYFMNSESEEIPDMSTLHDEESCTKQFMYVPKNVEKYKERIRDVVLDFVKYNYDF